MKNTVRLGKERLCIEAQCYDHVSCDPFSSEILFKCKCFPDTLINPCLVTGKRISKWIEYFFCLPMPLLNGLTLLSIFPSPREIDRAVRIIEF